MNNDLISRSAAIEIAMLYCPDDDGSCSKANVDIREMLDDLENLPGIDAEPVRHGQWHIVKDGHGGELLECPHCRFAFRRLSPRRYCPNCGTKMDAEVK